MSKLGPISWRELVRRLRVLGFDGPYQEGKHPFMVRNTLRLPIPNAHAGDVGARVLRLARVSRDDWEALG